ncbi:MAG: M1 family metallopeptidase [Gemmatimonadetes bacterium]|nr:M1 family metallopeptidase [Gemmatimonadota bacterium]
MGDGWSVVGRGDTFTEHRRLTTYVSRLLLLALGWTSPATSQSARPIDILEYHFQLTLPEAGSTIDGQAQISLRRLARGGAADTLRLDLLDLTVKSVRVGTRDADFSHANGVIRIPLGPGGPDSIGVTVSYTGAVKDGLIVSTDSAKRWMAFGDNWPNRARHWLPTVDHPSDKAIVTWRVLAPADRKVVANGRLVEEAPVAEREDPDGHAGAAVPMRLTTWRESNPIPTYLMVIAAAPLVEFPLGNTACGYGPNRGCVPQMVYTLPEQRRILPGAFAEADSVVTFLGRTFGPFGYEKLAHLQSSTRYGGMENAGAIFYADRLFRTSGVSYGLLAHETVHQWFGDMVTAREWSHVWLSEGWATYGAAMYTQHSRGDSAFRAQMAGIRSQILNAPVVASRPVIDTVETTLTALLNTNSYQKGGFVLHMLREEIGNAAFLQGARIYQDRHRHGTALTNDLRSAMELAAAKSLAPFFTQWLTRPGFPEIETQWRHDAATGRFTLTVTQSGRFGLFTFPLTVEFADATGAPHRSRLVVPAQRESVFTLSAGLRAAPTRMRVDPDVQLLARITEK